MDPFEAFKKVQKEGWAHFAPLETVTTPAAARLVRLSRIAAGQLVLDVCCGTASSPSLRRGRAPRRRDSI